MTFSSGLLLLTTGFLMGITLTLLNVIKPQINVQDRSYQTSFVEIGTRRDDSRAAPRDYLGDSRAAPREEKSK